MDNSHISEPALELHGMAALSVRGNITTQLVLTQGEIPEEGSRKKLVQGRGRESGNDFRVPEIGLKNSCFSFILFPYPHVIPSCFSKWLSFLGADFRFWN